MKFVTFIRVAVNKQKRSVYSICILYLTIYNLAFLIHKKNCEFSRLFESNTVYFFTPVFRSYRYFTKIPHKNLTNPNWNDGELNVRIEIWKKKNIFADKTIGDHTMWGDHFDDKLNRIWVVYIAIKCTEKMIDKLSVLVASNSWNIPCCTFCFAFFLLFALPAHEFQMW